MHLFYALVRKEEKIHYVSRINFVFEVTSIDFWQILHFDVKGTVCNLASIWHKLWEDSIYEWPLSKFKHFSCKEIEGIKITFIDFGKVIISRYEDEVNICW